ncbi:hypothetical protein [Corynebacterium cystitidis]|uniref:hypothetical protein n=1 Tax=Corynebacterium cystitidis TaxID=35757 RepID=UPI00211E024B|nr:hypothetical protein [Corynebacterium cystitidis]
MATTEHPRPTHSIVAAMIRIMVIFFVLSLWALFIAIGYAYRRVDGTGLIGWIRLPEGVAPFANLNLDMADVIAYGALFVAILLASTVQMSSTVNAADDIANRRPTTPEEAHKQQEELGVYSNQAEMAMIVSFGSAFAVLVLTALFGTQELALAATDDSAVDQNGVGWAGFGASLHALAHPRVVFMYIVSFLLFLSTYASMPSWKNTGMFRRQVEENAWGARAQLRVIAREHNLDNVRSIANPAGATTATLLGYALYVIVFVLALNLALVVIAGGQGFDNLLTWDRWPMMLILAVLAFMISTAVGTAMLYYHHLNSRSNALVVVSLVLTIAGIFYIVLAEGITWAIALGIVVLTYAGWWAFLYFRAVGVLDQKDPATWEFLLNPPKFIVMRRYEAIRAAADRVTDLDESFLDLDSDSKS